MNNALNHRLLVYISLLLLVLTAPMPWLTFSLVGSISFNLIDFYREFLLKGIDGVGQVQTVVVSGSSQYITTAVGMAVSLVLYLVTIVLCAAYIGINRLKMVHKLVLLTGIATIISTASFIYAVEAMKASFTFDETGLGTASDFSTRVLGPQFFKLIPRVIRIDAGPYAAAAAGFLMILAYLLAPKPLQAPKIVEQTSREDKPEATP